MSRINLPMLTVKAMRIKWNTVPKLDQYSELSIGTFPAMLDYFNRQGWDVKYFKGEYTIPADQLDFFLLTL